MITCGTMVSVPSLEIGKDTVYIRENPVWVEETLDENGNMLVPAHWEYEETQKTVVDYIASLKTENQNMKHALGVLGVTE